MRRVNCGILWLRTSWMLPHVGLGNGSLLGLGLGLGIVSGVTRVGVTRGGNWWVFFLEKIWQPFLVSASESDDFFSLRLLTTHLPMSFIQCSSKFSHKKLQSVYTAGTGCIFFGYWKAVTIYIKVPYSVPSAFHLCRLFVGLGLGLVVGLGSVLVFLVYFWFSM